MPATSRSPEPFHVVIAGGGVAALEAALALRQLRPETLRVTLIAPNAEFVFRAMTVREPFAYGAAERYPLAELAAEIGAELIVERLGVLDARERTVRTEAGAAITYDALILALGASPRPYYAHAVTIDDRRLDELLHGLIQDVEGGYVHDVAFVVPPRMAWPLPIYELALMTAHRAYEMNLALAVTIVTPEATPLAIFGDGGSSAVASLLGERGITVITGASSQVPDSRSVIVTPGDRRLAVDRVVALPELYGPSIPGLAADTHGFIPVDANCRVRGFDRVYAAGDATDSPLKHGSIAAQQADTAAQAIAELAGLPVAATPLHPVIHGTLLTGTRPLYLTARIIGGRGFSSEVTDAPSWPPPSKLAARYLAPYLAERDRLRDDARIGAGAR
jgi:sulfide:quinone oxidoreductase